MFWETEITRKKIVEVDRGVFSFFCVGFDRIVFLFWPVAAFFVERPFGPWLKVCCAAGTESASDHVATNPNTPPALLAHPPALHQVAIAVAAAS